jgi:curved DNA-binding protein CbpA
MSTTNNATDTFGILGIPIQTEAELDVIDEGLIKRSYRRLALKLHPDKNKNDPDAENKFNQLKNAHDSLMNSTTRVNFIALARAALQRRRDMESRNKEKQKFASDLEKREAEYMASIYSKGPTSFRSRHRHMVEQLEAKRKAASHAQLKKNQAEDPSAKIYPPPDDSNTDMNYWFQYAMNEPEDIRCSRQDEFSKFIAQKLV